MATGREYVAADAGDYVYPSDVRINRDADLLYVKAHGLAGGVREETWLFEYDLHENRLLTRVQVQQHTLPRECPDSNK